MIFVLASVAEITRLLHDAVDPEILKLRYEIDAVLSEAEHDYNLASGMNMIHLDADKMGTVLLNYLLRPIQHVLYSPVVATPVEELNSGYADDIIARAFDVETMLDEMEVSLGSETFRVSYQDAAGNTETHIENMDALFTDSVIDSLEPIFRKFYATVSDEIKQLLLNNLDLFVRQVTGK